MSASPRSLGSSVHVRGRIDAPLGRWRWLVKWFLAIPHFIVLVFLWIAFIVLTVVAGISIAITGRYPASIFRFNVGVLRWSWRVQFYAFTSAPTATRRSRCNPTTAIPPTSTSTDPSACRAGWCG